MTLGTIVSLAIHIAALIAIPFVLWAAWVRIKAAVRLYL